MRRERLFERRVDGESQHPGQKGMRHRIQGAVAAVHGIDEGLSGRQPIRLTMPSAVMTVVEKWSPPASALSTLSMASTRS